MSTDLLWYESLLIRQHAAPVRMRLSCFNGPDGLLCRRCELDGAVASARSVDATLSM